MLLSLIVALALSADPCTGAICINATGNDSSADLTAVNRSVAQVALHLELELQNASSSRGAQVDLELPPGETVPLTHIATLGGAWRYHYTYRTMFGRVNAVHDPHAVYALPYERGTTHKLVQGANGGYTHQGAQAFAWDFDMPEGTPIRAARAGTVIDVRDTETEHGEGPEFASRGNLIFVLHADGTVGQYYHLQPHGARVKVGDVVQQGALLGLSGNTGQTRGPHLHFEVNQRVDARNRQTILVRFRTAEGNGIMLETGHSYTAIE